jgi:hypothetical protein
LEQLKEHHTWRPMNLCRNQNYNRVCRLSGIPPISFSKLVLIPLILLIQHCLFPTLTKYCVWDFCVLHYHLHSYKPLNWNFMRKEDFKKITNGC